MKNKKVLLITSTLCINIFLSPLALAIENSNDMLGVSHEVSSDKKLDEGSSDSINDASNLSEKKELEGILSNDSVIDQEESMGIEDLEVTTSDTSESNNFVTSNIAENEVLSLDGYQSWGPTASWRYDEATNTLTLKGTLSNPVPVKKMVPQFSEIKQINIEGTLFLEGKIFRFFSDLPNVESIESNKIDVSQATNMGSLFSEMNSVVALDVSNWNTSNVTDMDFMFFGLHSLTNIDVSNWNTANVTNMRFMFSGVSSLTSLDVSNWNISNVSTMDAMFSGNSSLTNLDLSKWNTGKVTSMGSMFRGVSLLTTLNVSNWNTSNVTNMSLMFKDAGSLTTLEASNWNTSNLVNTSYMFEDAKSLTTLDVSNWDTSNVSSMGSMFSGASSLTTLNVSNWDTSNVVDMNAMFSNAFALITLDVSTWDTGNVTKMGGLFVNAKSLTNLDVSNWNTSNVTAMNRMFAQADALTYLDVSNWDTSKVVRFDGMFSNAGKLATIVMGPLSKFDTTAGLGNNSLQPYTGKWLLKGNSSHSYASSSDFMENYNGTFPGTYYRERVTAPTVQEYTVTFESNGGSAVASQMVKENETIVKPSTPTKTGYTFIGWYTDASLMTSYDFTSTVISDTVLYAKWEEETAPTVQEYTVTFESNGGSAVASQTVKENELAIQPEFPKKEGEIFVGWYSDEDLTQPFDFNTPITQATVVYASWLMNDEPMPMYTIPVYYQNEKGEAISETVLLSGAKGETYQAEQKIIPGYVLKEVIGEPSGKFGFEGLLSFRNAETIEKRNDSRNTSKTITYVYKKELSIEKNDKPKVNNEKQNTQKNQTSYSKKQKTLPKTGERVTLSLSTMGMFLLFIVSYITGKKKRNKI